MISLKEVLFLLLFAACAKALCSNATICITNGDEGESQCQHHQQIFHTLSELTINQTSCESVHIYLTSGTHILSRNLDFNNSVQETVIRGAYQGPPSIIECQGETGIEFSENTSVKMELITLLHCNRTRKSEQRIQAALFFKNAQYTLSGVTVKNTEGWGVYAEDCWEQIIFNCTFINNKGNIAIRGTAPVVLVEINDTKIHDGKQFDPRPSIFYHGTNGVDIHLLVLNFTLRIFNCNLQRNQGGNFHLRIIDNDMTPNNNSIFTILIDNSTFNMSDGYGGIIQFTVCRFDSCNEYNNIDVTLRRSSFIKNNESGLILIDTTHLKIEDCIFHSNTDNGVKVLNYGNDNQLLTEISNTSFISNSRAIDFLLSSIDVKISECRFTNHTGNSVVAIRTGSIVISTTGPVDFHITGSVVIEKSSLQGNRKLNEDKDCSVLSINSVGNVTLSDVNITNNNCTGIKLIDSTVKVENMVTLSGNHGRNGGGLSLSMSKLIFSTSSKLNIINNSADAYGGGIYIEEETCTSDNTCFFQPEEEYPPIKSEIIAISENHADKEGDQVLGGCLSNCSIQNKIFLSVCDLNNKFWDFVSSESVNTTLLSYQKKVSFCKNHVDSSISGFSCSYSNTINVYRGEMFNVPLMIADDCCFPSSVEYIEAKIKLPLQFKQNPGSIQKYRKLCYNYSYTLKGGFGLKTPSTIEFSTPQLGITPLNLTVNIEECPIVYKEDSESGECVCHDILKSHKVECTPSNKSLHLPAQTWLGELWNESESIAVQNDCQYCKTEEMDLIIPIDSNKLCILNYNRTGIMCGACVSSYSLLLGGYECADCSGSTYKGVLLFLAFITIGIV